MRRLWIVIVCACGPSGPQPPRGPPRPPPERPITAVDPPKPSLRLPRHFTPTGYTARLAIDPSQPTFSGEIAIAGTLAVPTRVIWLHGHELTMRDGVAKHDAKTVALTVELAGDDLLAVRAAEPLTAGGWTIELAYTGKVSRDTIAGAFHSTQGKDDYVLTQLEPTYARRVFPCLDEPDRKVPWQLTLDVPSQHIAVSNTPVVRTTAIDAGHTRVEFARTRPLPSYLIALAVGPFEIVDAGKSASGIPVRIVVPRGTADRAGYARAVTPKLIDQLEAWFGAPFPYPKLDVIVAPAFDNDAMENAGAIISDPILVLLDRDHPSWHARHNIVEFIGHELAHQWFGDLVTPTWWDELWLNEGFATWLENWIGVRFEPSWHDEGQFLSIRNDALRSDSVPSARRIREPITDDASMINAFDGITYQKGASVLRMVERYIGEAAFQNGVRAYLGAHVDGVATAADLVASLETASGKPLRRVFESFLDQAGAPTLTMQLVCDGQPRVTIEQHRTRTAGSAVAHEQTWSLPVCVAYGRDGKRERACGMLTEEHGSIALDGQCPAWLIGNADGDGYYYTALSAGDVDTVRDRAWPLLTTSDRRTVLEDARAQVLLGKVPVAKLMSIATKLLASDDKLAIGDALGGTGRGSALARMTGLPFAIDPAVSPALRDGVARKIRTAIAPRLREVGLEGRDTDDFGREVTREAVVGTAGFVSDPALARQAVALSARYRELPKAIRPLVLQLAADADPGFGDRLSISVTADTDVDRRREILAALVRVRDPKRRSKYLDLALDPRLDALDRVTMVFASDTEATRAGIETWMRAHWPQLATRFPPPTEVSFVRFFGGLFTGACDPARRDEIAAYVVKEFGPYMGARLVTKQQIEDMDQCIAQRAIVEPSIRDWSRR